MLGKWLCRRSGRSDQIKRVTKIVSKISFRVESPQLALSANPLRERQKDGLKGVPARGKAVDAMQGEPGRGTVEPLDWSPRTWRVGDGRQV